jgi:hypothetical protein
VPHFATAGDFRVRAAVRGTVWGWVRVSVRGYGVCGLGLRRSERACGLAWSWSRATCHRARGCVSGLVRRGEGSNRSGRGRMGWRLWVQRRDLSRWCSGDCGVSHHSSQPSRHRRGKMGAAPAAHRTRSHRHFECFSPCRHKRPPGRKRIEQLGYMGVRQKKNRIVDFSKLFFYWQEVFLVRCFRPNPTRRRASEGAGL